VARYPWQAACIALLLASLWLWHGKSVALSDLKDCKAGRAADQAQWNRQVEAAKIATAKAKQDGKVAANDAETYHAQLQAETGKLADYIAARRVRTEPRSPAPASAGRRDDPAVHEEPAAVPTVAVPDSVLNTCDADYTYAAGAYQLGQELIAKGLAVQGH
jgi:hypothetical protein